MSEFQPDYTKVVDCARNREVDRTPLYEHNVSYGIMERIEGRDYGWGDGSPACLDEFFVNYCGFFRDHGYDVVTFEACITPILPGGGNLAGHVDPPAIADRADFERYPWADIERIWFDKYGEMFAKLRNHLPAGMKAIGGVGNGVFEIAEDLVGYENLVILGYDDPDLYADLFCRIGDMMMGIWARFLREYGDAYCVLRIGDDLGYKSNTLISYDDIRAHIIPQYRRLVGLVHETGKPFLLHSCGNLFGVFDDLIAGTGIDAKHSNEDQIAPFREWVDRYGDRIGNFGGIDTDHLVRMPEDTLRKLVYETWDYCHAGHGGFCLGSGNSIPDYVDPARYLAMIETVREARGDFRER